MRLPPLTPENLKRFQEGKDIYKPRIVKSSHEEEDLQKACVTYFELQYPQLRGLLCYNLNNSAHKLAGAKNRAMGLIPGRSDLVLYFHGTAYMIELKTPKGRQSPVQKEWQHIIEKQGFEYFIIRSVDEFIALIERITAK